MKNIEYEKNGVKKFAQERFKEELAAAGWVAVEEKTSLVEENSQQVKKRGRPFKKEGD